MAQAKNDVTLSVKAPERKPGRYTVAVAVPTTDGGRVGVGVDKTGAPALVFEVGYSQTGIPMHAVASALVGEAIPVAVLVQCFRESDTTGKNLKRLAAEVAKASGN